MLNILLPGQATLKIEDPQHISVLGQATLNVEDPQYYS